MVELDQITVDEFIGALKKHGVQDISRRAFYLGADPCGVIDIKSSLSDNPGWVRIGHFAYSDGNESMLKSVVLHNGPVNNLNYLKAYAGLKSALQAEGIPFTEMMDAGKLRANATQYAADLYEASLRI